MPIRLIHSISASKCYLLCLAFREKRASLISYEILIKVNSLYSEFSLHETHTLSRINTKSSKHFFIFYTRTSINTHVHEQPWLHLDISFSLLNSLFYPHSMESLL